MQIRLMKDEDLEAVVQVWHTSGLPEPRLQAMLQEAGFSQIVVHDHGHPLNMFYEVRI